MYPDSPIWIAWAAGTLERGRFLNKHGRMKLRLESDNGELVERFHQAVKVGLSKAIPTKSFGKHQYRYIWETESLEDVMEVIDLLLPFVTRKQADNFVALRKQIQESASWQEANS